MIGDKFDYFDTEFGDKNCEIVIQASDVTAFIIFYKIHTVWIYRKTINDQKTKLSDVCRAKCGLSGSKMVHTMLQLELTVKIIITVDLMRRK